jgi:hypothetical protein
MGARKGAGRLRPRRPRGRRHRHGPGDVTERKLATEALQQSANDIRQAADEIHDLYNRAPCGYHSLDTHGTFVRINDTELSWLG